MCSQPPIILAKNKKTKPQLYTLKNFLMHGLLISPREVMNARTLATLLAVGEVSEERQLLAELLQSYPQRFEAILDEIIPDFSRAFEGLQTFAQEEEVSVSRGAEPGQALVFWFSGPKMHLALCKRTIWQRCLADYNVLSSSLG